MGFSRQEYWSGVPWPSPDLLLLLLSRFSRVRLCATPLTAAHQAPLTLGFSRQEHWSGLPFPSPMHESESEDTQSYPTLSDPMDCSLPGSSVHEILQAKECTGVGCHKILEIPKSILKLRTSGYFSAFQIYPPFDLLISLSSQHLGMKT